MTIITVDTTADIIDPGDGALSLREALALADATEAADTILFADAVQGRTIVLAGSQLTVASDVTIDGGSGVTLDADDRSRVLLIEYGGGGEFKDVTLANLTVTGGRTTGRYEDGGGIAVFGRYSSLTLDRVIVTGNSTGGRYAFGGGISAPAEYSYVSLIGSTVSGNRTTGNSAEGGGIYGYAVSLTNSTVSGNRTAGDAAEGGGIAGYYVSLTDSTVRDNRTSGEYARGGGISGEEFGSLSLTNSTVSDNRTAGADADGGGIYGDFVLVTDSTVSGNSTSGAEAQGGGISGYSTASIWLTNSTVSSNRTTGTYAGGGGVSGHSVRLTNSTISDNRTSGPQADGGGISAGDYGIEARNSIVAGNVAGGADHDVAGAIVASNGLNIFGSDVDGNTPSDRENVAASLLFDRGLAENGGPTQTVALRDAGDNPALGRADPTSDDAPTTDQRGEPRPQPAGTNPDIGAFELDQSDPTPPPAGTTFAVTSTSDVSADDGELTLREALALADADSLTADRIEFAPTVQGQSIVLGGSQLTINSDVTIDGGAGVTIDANQMSRVLLVQGLDTDVTLRQLTITGGRTTGDEEGGGGVRADSNTTLTVEQVSVVGNGTAGYRASGGGIVAYDVTLIDSMVSGNSTGGNDAGGGGLSGFRVTLINSRVADNRTGGGNAAGGGLSGSDVKLTNSTVEGNGTVGDRAGGGGISGAATLIGSTISGNSTTGAFADGGGISGAATLIGSTVSGNSTVGLDAVGGGISTGQFSAGVTLTNSTVSGNETAGDRAAGGGIYGVSSVTLTNSTVSGNSTAGIQATGGGISGSDRSTFSAVVTLTNSTVSGNGTTGAEAGGGGVFAGGLGFVTAANSVVAGNTATASPNPDITGDIRFSNGLNIFGSDVSGNSSSDRENVPASLLFAGGLADNGGPTQTIALRDAVDNPALGRADPATALATDQRGVVRPAPEGTNPDAGAFELDQSNPSPPPVGTTFIVTTTGDASADDGLLTLREALALADADNLTADRIEFSSEVQGQAIILGGSQLTVGSDVTIDGGAGVTIDANQESRVILAQGLGTDVALRHLTITGGRTAGQDDVGGGIRADRFVTLALEQVTIAGNSTTGNYADGGGVHGFDVTLINSTVSGNNTIGSRADGGGIFLGGYYSGGSGPLHLTLTNCTVSGNAAAGSYANASGIYGRFVALANTIVVGNTSPSGNGVDLAGSISVSNGHNIFGSDVEGNAPGDLENVPASLLFAGALADNGGPTQTIALRDDPTNPALGGADPATAPATDQRGVARPQPAGTNPDIGSLELGASPPVIVIDGTPRDDTLRGTACAELLRGRAGSDRLWGFDGDDELFGGFGADVLVGGPGLDRMTGGAGADRFVLRQPEAAPAGGPAYDEVLDFTRSQQDRVDLQPIDARSGAAGNQSFAFIETDAFTRAGQLRYEATADGDFLVSGNIDRDLAADFAFIVRSGVAILKGSDFLL